MRVDAGVQFAGTSPLGIARPWLAPRARKREGPATGQEPKAPEAPRPRRGASPRKPQVPKAFVEQTALSTSYQNQAINAIKLYDEAVVGRSLDPVTVPRPRKEKKLPTVLSEEEVALVLREIKDLKHRCAIFLIYSAGLRRSEVLHLKPCDIDSERTRIIVRDAKGKKDRVTLLSLTALALRRAYYRQYGPRSGCSRVVREASTVPRASGIICQINLRRSGSTNT